MTYKPSCKEEVEFLENFDPTKYQNPGVAADTALFAVRDDELYILLIERGSYPFKGCWALPGGFVNMDEDLADSAKRELLEETGISIEYLERAAVWGKPDRDPRQRVITVSFLGLIDFDDTNATAGDDAAKAEWFKINDYNKTEGEKSFISYTLLGSKQMSAGVSYPGGRIQEIVCEQSGGLAFDHAESIATSIELLKERADIIADMSLGKQKANSAAEIIKNL